MGHLRVLALTLVLVVGLSHGSSGMTSVNVDPHPLFHVRFENAFKEDILTVPLETYAKDLGFHNATQTKPYEDVFRESLGGESIYSNLTRGGRRKRLSTGRFEAFSYLATFLDECGRPGNICKWIARDDGVYLQNSRTEKEVLEYGWHPCEASCRLSLL